MLAVADAQKTLIFSHNGERFEKADEKECGSQVGSVDLSENCDWLLSICETTDDVIFEHNRQASRFE